MRTLWCNLEVVQCGAGGLLCCSLPSLRCLTLCSTMPVGSSSFEGRTP